MKKIVISTCSFTVLFVCFMTAAPMIQQERTTLQNEVSNMPSKSVKKLNFIQKIILKKIQKKADKTSDEKQYRKMAIWAALLGLLAIPMFFVMLFFPIILSGLGILGANFLWMFPGAMMIGAIVMGTIAFVLTENKVTRMIAILGIALGVVSISVSIAFIVRFINDFFV